MEKVLVNTDEYNGRYVAVKSFVDLSGNLSGFLAA